MMLIDREGKVVAVSHNLGALSAEAEKLLAMAKPSPDAKPEPKPKAEPGEKKPAEKEGESK